ncbi:MAG: Cyanate hydratase [Trebouxia sp. A1-2]|nr:MAG: Cyanate hydratase [Trebouxia sp. A1-2]
MALKGALSMGRLSNSMVSRQALQKPRAFISRRGQSFSSTGTVLASMPPAGGPQPSPAGIPETRGMCKHDLVGQLLAAKEASGKTFTQISKEIGLTNAFTAQLFYNQAQLKSGREEVLRKACPALTDELVAAMKRAPMRGFDPSILKEPHIYRMTEAVTHYGESIKAIMNEELGDGIMSAIDMYATIDVIKGKAGENRLVISLNGKFLPHVEQVSEDNTAKSPK